MKVLIAVTIAIILSLGVGIASYSIGVESGKAAVEAELNQAQNDLVGLRGSCDIAVSRNQELIDRNNQLVDDYNQLEAAVIQYVDATQHQARKPVYCTSTAYGSDGQFTSTRRLMQKL